MSIKAVRQTSTEKIHNPRRHAAVRTTDYVFSQLIPYIGNKRKLLHLIAEAVRMTGCRGGVFADLFAGSTVVARWAKKAGFRAITNDWEPYSYEIARGTVALNAPPAFEQLGGSDAVFAHLNSIGPLYGYVSGHLCPADDDHADPMTERMFFTRANGERIDAIREQIVTWEAEGLVSADERAYLLASLLYAVSYVSNTSGVFKAYHNGWGGKTGTALYRILSDLKLTPPVLLDNGRDNLAVCGDAQQLAGRLSAVAGGPVDIAYIDPPYNQHPYGSNYHVLNTVALWDKPAVNRRIRVDGKVVNKSAIRTDWRTDRRSPYNHRQTALAAMNDLVSQVDARWVIVSYSTDGNIPLEGMLRSLAERGSLQVVVEPYKRYRVSTPRMSAKSHNVEFAAVIDRHARPTPGLVEPIAEEIRQCEQAALSA